MNIGKKIAERRKELGMTQEALAEKLSLSAQAVSKWENGWNLPDIENIRLIAEALKMSPSALIGEDRQTYEWELRDQLMRPIKRFISSGNSTADNIGKS